MVDIIEKSDLFNFEHRMMAFLEKIAAEPMKQWYSKKDLAELRFCSESEFYKNKDLLPNFGIPEDRWGRTPVWSRATVKEWLILTREQLVEKSDDRTPEEIEKHEYLRESAVSRDGQIRLVK